MGTCASLPAADGLDARQRSFAVARLRAPPAAAAAPTPTKTPAAPDGDPAGPAGRSAAAARRFAIIWGAGRLNDSALSIHARGGAAAGAAASKTPAPRGGPLRFIRVRTRTARASAAAARVSPSLKTSKKPLRPRCLVTGEPIPDFGVDGVFDVLTLLGEGGSAATYLARDVATHALVAVKFLARPLPKLAVPLLVREVQLQARLGQAHPNIVGLRELVLTQSHVALVMDYAAGGTLTDAVTARWESALERGGLHVSESEARFLFRQLTDALAFIHENRVAHRDLKLDNTLLDGPLESAPRLRLCDFGFARGWGPNGSGDMHTALGTPVYMSPQVLGTKYGNQGFCGASADVWAAGVMLFCALFGCFPFDHDRHRDPNSDQAHLEVSMSQERLASWRDNPRACATIARGVLSVDCADLLDKMLQKDESKRISVSQIRDHPWLEGPLQSEQQEGTWQQLQEERSQLVAAAQQPRAAAQLKRLNAAILAMMATATRTDADAPLHLPNEPPPSTTQPTTNGGADGERDRQRQRIKARLRHDSTPTIAVLNFLQAAKSHQSGTAAAGSRDLRSGGSGAGGTPRRRASTDIPGWAAVRAAAAGAAGLPAAAVAGVRNSTALLSFPLSNSACGSCTPSGGGATSPLDNRAPTPSSPPAAAPPQLALPRPPSVLELLLSGQPLTPQRQQPKAQAAAAAGGGGGNGGSASRAATPDLAVSVAAVDGGSSVEGSSHAAWASAAAELQLQLPRSSSSGSGGGAAAAPQSPPLSPPPAAERVEAPFGIVDARPAGGGLLWRLPMVVWAPDEALAIPLPELQVAAGALIRQLQIPAGDAAKPRLGALCKRMSWPMAPPPADAPMCASGLDGF